jgi:hypothetical protein
MMPADLDYGGSTPTDLTVRIGTRSDGPIEWEGRVVAIDRFAVKVSVESGRSSLKNGASVWLHFESARGPSLSVAGMVSAVAAGGLVTLLLSLSPKEYNRLLGLPEPTFTPRRRGVAPPLMPPGIRPIKREEAPPPPPAEPPAPAPPPAAPAPAVEPPGVEEPPPAEAPAELAEAARVTEPETAWEEPVAEAPALESAGPVEPVEASAGEEPAGLAPEPIGVDEPSGRDVAEIVRDLLREIQEERPRGEVGETVPEDVAEVEEPPPVAEPVDEDLADLVEELEQSAGREMIEVVGDDQAAVEAPVRGTESPGEDLAELVEELERGAGDDVVELVEEPGVVERLPEPEPPRRYVPEPVEAAEPAAEELAEPVEELERGAGDEPVELVEEAAPEAPEAEALRVEPAGAPSAEPEPVAEPAIPSLADRAAALAARGDYVGAWQLYYEALQASPGELALWYALGVTLTHLDRQKEAEEVFDYVVGSGNPDSPEVRHAREWLASARAAARLRAAASPQAPAGPQPVQFAPSAPSAAGQSWAAVRGKVSWREPESPREALIVLQGLEKGLPRIHARVPLGDFYEFDRLPAGRYHLIGGVENQWLWDVRFDLGAGQELDLDLTRHNSSNPRARV